MGMIIRIFFVLLITVCVTSGGLFAGVPREDGLQIKIVPIETDDGSKVLDWSKPFQIVIKNHSPGPIEIPHPATKAGHDLVSFEFKNLETGETKHTKKCAVENQKYFETLLKGLEPGQHIKTLPPGEEFVFDARLMDYLDFTYTFGSDIIPLWQNLPEPGTDANYQIRPILNTNILRPHNKNVDGLAIEHAPITAKIIASGFHNPHAFLRFNQPEIALRQMQRDREWIIRVDETHSFTKWTPLHYAAKFGHLEVIKWLLENGANVNALDERRQTPLHLATDPNVVTEILKYKPLLTIIETQTQQTAFQHAVESSFNARTDDAKRQWGQVADLLLEAGSEYDINSAVYRDDLERVKQIAAREPDIFLTPKDKHPLRIAAQTGRFEMCELIIKSGDVDVNQFQQGEGLPIIYHAMRYPRIVQLLIDNGADFKTPFKHTPYRGGIVFLDSAGKQSNMIHYAAQLAPFETFVVLAEAGLDVFADSSGSDVPTGKSPVEIAADFAHADKVIYSLNLNGFKSLETDIQKLVINQCLGKTAGNDRYREPQKQLQLVEDLLNRGADPNFVDPEGATPIALAAKLAAETNDQKRQTIIDIVRLLEQFGGKLDLCSAIAIKETELVQRLLSENDKLAATTRFDGFSPLHIAVMTEQPDLVKKLLSLGADINAMNSSHASRYRQQTAIFVAAEEGRYEMVKLLLDQGADPNVQEYNQRTPLHIAIKRKHYAIAIMLALRGAKHDLVDRNKKTPADYLYQVHSPEEKRLLNILTKPIH